MKPLTPQELFAAWDHGMNAPLTLRALWLLAYASPETNWETLESLPVGTRDYRLLMLREWTFGSQVTCSIYCPQCGEHLELAFETDAIRSAPPENESFSLEADGYQVVYRSPNSRDLLRAPAQSLREGHDQVFADCILEALQDDVPVGWTDLPDSIVEQVVAGMEAANEQSDVRFDLTCAVCQCRWQTLFDIVTYFWDEIDRWAKRMVADIHVIAGAYGWSEGDILALNPRRRKLYIDLIQS